MAAETWSTKITSYLCFRLQMQSSIKVCVGIDVQKKAAGLHCRALHPLHTHARGYSLLAVSRSLERWFMGGLL